MRVYMYNFTNERFAHFANIMRNGMRKCNTALFLMIHPSDFHYSLRTRLFSPFY